MLSYNEKYENWCVSEQVDEALKWELAQIKDDPLRKRLCFEKDLEFGTAGLRGILGAGSACMNTVTVGWISAGFAKVIAGQKKADRGVVIGRDSRLMSKEFAVHAARVFAAYGVKVYLFDDIRPTAAVSFAVLRLGAAAGVNITASHNPKEYNGYKAYGEDGVQLSPEMAAAVVAAAGDDMLTPVDLCDFDAARDIGLIELIGGEMDADYLACVKESAVESLTPEKGFKTVYTPFYGSGYKLVPRLMRERGYEVIVCKDQEMPNGNFPTANPPNPERREAFAAALELAKKQGAQLVLGTDPDADRLGALTLHRGEYVMLTGNQMGVLMCHYILDAKKAAGLLPQDGFVAKSLVSTDMAGAVCEEFGIECVNVLTGFKYIGYQVDLLEVGQGRKFLFGFEESYGYLGASYARDKDAVYAAMLFSDMALSYYKQGKDLIEVLEGLYEKYGYYLENTIGLDLDPISGLGDLALRMAALHENPPVEMGGLRVERVVDYNRGGGALPAADILGLELEGGSKLFIRPSGTEPKVKLYVMCRAQTKTEVRTRMQALSGALEELVRL